MKNLIVFLIALLTTLTSCSFAYYQEAGSVRQMETNPEMIKIYSGDIEQDYAIIGPVAADVLGDADAAAKYLKKKASKLGADAIIKVDLTKVSSFTMQTGISGIAVKIKES